MEAHGEVTDWAADFDVSDPAYNADPFPIWDDLRERCPVAHSGRYGGSWLPTRAADISAIATDPQRFTSRQVIVTRFRAPDVGPAGFSPPITSDPPFHGPARRMLQPAFSPAAVARLEAATRAYCEQLVGALRGRDLVDGAVEYAQHIPVQVTAHMLGLPERESERFRGFVHDVIETVAEEPEERFRRIQPFFAYLWDQVTDHVDRPRDDLISFLLGADLPMEQVGGTIALLLIAGIDTTWSAIGSALWHLAQHPGDRRRLAGEADLLVPGVEELLRAYAPVTMARRVRHDTEVAGVSLAAGDWVLLPFPAANRDPEAFADPDRVVLDRRHNRHVAFGEGIHRCLGAHLARMEMRVAISTWLAAFPDFELADPAAVRWSTGQIRGPRALPLRLGRGTPPSSPAPGR